MIDFLLKRDTGGRQEHNDWLLDLRWYTSRDIADSQSVSYQFLGAT